MQVNHVPLEAWVEFGKRFPKAADFLCAAELKGELETLKRMKVENEWMKKRVAELTEWNKQKDYLK